MSEDKQCLQREDTEGRCLEEECGKNALDDCMYLPFHRKLKQLFFYSEGVN